MDVTMQIVRRAKAVNDGVLEWKATDQNLAQAQTRHHGSRSHLSCHKTASVRP